MLEIVFVAVDFVVVVVVVVVVVWRVRKRLDAEPKKSFGDSSKRLI